MNLLLNLVFAKFLLLWSFLCFSQTIVVFGGAERGGAGDIATNILMAEQLAKEMPQARVYLVEPSDSFGRSRLGKKEIRTRVGRAPSRTLFHNLIGDAEYQKKNGVTVMTEKQFEKNKNKIRSETNIVLEFSMSDTSNLPLVADKWADIAWRFSEYDMTSGKGRFPKNFITDNRSGFEYLQAGIKDLGLYVSAVAPEPMTDFDSALAELRSLKTKKKYAAKGVKKGVPVELATGYAARAATMEKYVRGVFEAAQSTYSESMVVLAINTPKEFDIKRLVKEKPNNVELHVYRRMPFMTTRRLMQQATVPILVTGDVSVTLALEYEKPFLYEALTHKLPFKDRLIKRLGGYLRGENRKKLEAAISLRQMDNLEVSLGDKVFWEKMRTSIKKVRAKLSLPSKLATVLDAAACTLQGR